jgi:hypothetical protein
LDLFEAEGFLKVLNKGIFIVNVLAFPILKRGISHLKHCRDVNDEEGSCGMRIG